MRNTFKQDLNSFYFLGIGGISMSALAKYALSLKKRVGGSDIFPTEITEKLKSEGAHIDYGADCDLKNYDAVIYTDAISSADKRLKLARESGKKVIPRGKFLKRVCDKFSSVIAVSGCHGKTTCTAMLANIYFAAGKKFMAHIGGMDVNLGNFYYSGNDVIITEACEYKKNFLYLKPDIAVVLNTSPDHMECYKNWAELIDCYNKFLSRSQTSVSLYGEKCGCELTFGIDKKADVYARNIKCLNSGISFDMAICGKNAGNVKVKAYGRHNVINALAASAAAYADGMGIDDIIAGLENFNGVQRRMERIGQSGGAVCIADYAHHPDEIRAAYNAVKKLAAGNIYVIFQPHTYSRTKNLFSAFVKELSSVPRLLIYRTFAAREYYDDGGSAFTLFNAIKNARYGESAEDIKKFISGAGSGDIVLFLGAGDIYFIAKSLLG